uniref:MIT_C domain-containing protein n=1 Tax=Parastrongyloides trichosuri TaxID=131310 RepID=A0A0N4ZMS0_PARTI
MPDIIDEYISNARKLIVEGKGYEDEGKAKEASNLYLQVCTILQKAFKEMNSKDQRKNPVEKVLKEYVEKVEKLRGCFVSSKILNETIEINEDDVGYSFSKIFGRCIDDNTTAVRIEDPYIKSKGQTYNLTAFCEFLAKNGKNLSFISLKTGTSECNDLLKNLKNSLAERRITLEITFGDFHDRLIKFNNGWEVDLGRGLDIYKYSPPGALGFTDYSFRKCKKCRIRIFKI